MLMYATTVTAKVGFLPAIRVTEDNGATRTYCGPHPWKNEDQAAEAARAMVNAMEASFLAQLTRTGYSLIGRVPA